MWRTQIDVEYLLSHSPPHLKRFSIAFKFIVCVGGGKHNL